MGSVLCCVVHLSLMFLDVGWVAMCSPVTDMASHCGCFQFPGLVRPRSSVTLTTVTSTEPLTVCPNTGRQTQSPRWRAACGTSQTSPGLWCVHLFTWSVLISASQSALVSSLHRVFGTLCRDDAKKWQPYTTHALLFHKNITCGQVLSPSQHFEFIQVLYIRMYVCMCNICIQVLGHVHIMTHIIWHTGIPADSAHSCVTLPDHVHTTMPDADKAETHTHFAVSFLECISVIIYVHTQYTSINCTSTAVTNSEGLR